ncbi:MAG: hypothetical protein L3J29_09055 [Cyclobacteriaceae bacterium]|nr:hypothetical protein [Cyclobacteriaceae bacterium]
MTGLHGLTDLYSRVIVDKVNELKTEEEKESLLAKMKPEVRQNILNAPYHTPQFGQLSLKSVNDNQNIEINIDQLSNEFFNNSDYLLERQLRAAGILIVMAYELTKDGDIKTDLWNFFYHCRNAAAHGGSFNITNRKRFPAIWKNLDIKITDNGTNLFKDKDGNGLIQPGDPISLLTTYL